MYVHVISVPQQQFHTQTNHPLTSTLSIQPTGFIMTIIKNYPFLLVYLALHVHDDASVVFTMIAVAPDDIDLLK
jgi:hypothetical protein